MGDWTLPTGSSLYTAVWTTLKEHRDDQAKMFHNTTTTNLPTGTVRLNKTTGYFQEWNGATWTNITNIVAGASGDLTTHLAATNAHSATSTNTASRIVMRDASGNFSCGTMTGNVAGNVTGTVTGGADRWNNARTITLTGGVTGSTSIDGSGNVSIATTIVPSTSVVSLWARLTADTGSIGNSSSATLNLGGALDFGVVNAGDTFSVNYSESLCNAYCRNTNDDQYNWGDLISWTDPNDGTVSYYRIGQYRITATGTAVFAKADAWENTLTGSPWYSENLSEVQTINEFVGHTMIVTTGGTLSFQLSAYRLRNDDYHMNDTNTHWHSMAASGERMFWGTCTKNI